MTDESTSTDEPTTEDQASEEGNDTSTEVDGTQDEPTTEGDQPAEDDDSGLDREAALKALATARKDAAKYRTKLRETEKRFEGAKTPEEIEAIRAEIKQESAAEARALLVENVALAHGLPADLADALKGETREELEAHAKTLQKYAPSNEGGSDPEVRGGLDPTDDPDGTFDPRAEARALLKRRR